MKLLVGIILSCVIVVNAGPYRPFRRPRNGTVTDLWESNGPASCPPFPNCAEGHTCWVYQHPENCPVCKCVACPNKPCIPGPGEICHWEESSNGCNQCACEKCPMSLQRCQPGCRKLVPKNGCPFCKCPNTEKEVNGHKHVNEDIDENPVQRPSTPSRIAPVNPYDP